MSSIWTPNSSSQIPPKSATTPCSLRGSYISGPRSKRRWAGNDDSSCTPGNSSTPLPARQGSRQTGHVRLPGRAHQHVVQQALGVLTLDRVNELRDFRVIMVVCFLHHRDGQLVEPS